MLQEFLDVPNVQLVQAVGPGWLLLSGQNPNAGRTASVWCCQICSNSFLTPDSAGKKARSWDAHSNRAVEILRRTLLSHRVDVS